MEKSSRANKSKSQRKAAAKSNASSIVATLVLIAITAGIGGLIFTRAGTFESLTGPASAKKAIGSFSNFFLFYLTEHTDGISRLLHVIGTTLLVVVVLATNWRYALSMASALGVGLIVRELCIGLPNGFVEFGAMVATFLLLNRVLIGSFGIHLLIIGYGFAWVGHFFFEKNTPATFLYPSFSLMGDFRMWWGVLTRELPIIFK